VPDLAAVDVKAEANRLIAYHSPISGALTAERTALESKLIPVTAYIVVACLEAWYRWPEMVGRIDAAMPAEEIGRASRRPGAEVDTVRLWSLANFWLVGRNVMLQMDPSADRAEPAYEVLRFWERAAEAFRADGTRQAWDNGLVHSFEPEVVARLVDGAVEVDDELRGRIKRFNATLVNYLFLLWFDTRSGTQDTGPYPLPDGRTLLVRDFHRLSETDYWWSEVARDVPYRNLTAALVLDGVRFRVTDFGSSYTEPEDYLDRVVRFGLFTTDTPDRSLREVPLDELDGIVDVVRKAQSQHYRNVVAMDRHEKIRCGAYVYFTFLRPFAETAGVADDLDWTVPRDTPEPLYELLSQMEGGNAPPEGDGDYYPPIA
jgi:hypothetical protein